MSELKTKIELEVSDKTSGMFTKRPHIKKGYYPGKLIKVDVRKDQEGIDFEGKYGKQLILEFAVYQPGPEGEPVKPIMIELKEEGHATTFEALTLPNFVYYMYKDKKGNFQTAVTPNSAITKIFKALGWEFNASKPLIVEDYLEHWVELNIDDYEAYEDKVKKEGAYKASTIKNVNVYDGPIINTEKTVPVPTKKVVPKQEKAIEVPESFVEESVEEEVVGRKSVNKLTAEKLKQFNALESKKVTLKEMCNEGMLTPEGYDSAIEQIDKQLMELRK